MRENSSETSKHKLIFLAQVVSVALIWVFVIGIGVWIANLISLSFELHDFPGASVGISIVAIPVFFTLAGILTYVFVGLQKKHPPSKSFEEK